MNIDTNDSTFKANISLKKGWLGLDSTFWDGYNSREPRSSVARKDKMLQAWLKWLAGDIKFIYRERTLKKKLILAGQLCFSMGSWLYTRSEVQTAATDSEKHVEGPPLGGCFTQFCQMCLQQQKHQSSTAPLGGGRIPTPHQDPCSCKDDCRCMPGWGDPKNNLPDVWSWWIVIIQQLQVRILQLL